MISLLYGLFGTLDLILYSFASSLFKLVYKLAGVDLFNSDTILPIVNRIYIVVGVLMLFKLAVLGVQYMINPDSFDDKNKGMGGFLKKVAISIALIVVVPAIFNFAYSIQGSIVKAIPKIVLGNEEVAKFEEDEKNEENSLGFKMSFDILSLFIRRNDKVAAGTYVTNAASDVGEALGIGRKVGVGRDEDGQEKYEIYNFTSFSEHVSDGCPPLILKTVGVNWTDCEYSYDIFISTICGGFLCYILLSMAIDIAIRSIKLGIIEVLSPIAISSYIFSDDKLKKLGKTALGVYVDLFIRLIIVYFIVFMLKIFQGNGFEKNLFENISNDAYMRTVIRIVLIFGLLIFAKKAPAFITDLLGLKDVGSGDMADMFKPFWQRAGGAFGYITNPAANAIANFRQSKGRSTRERLMRAAGGFGRGVVDSVQGIGAGDNWAKMRSRHEASTRKSLERMKTAINRENNEKNGQTRLDNIKNRINNLRNKLRAAEDPAVNTEAENRYNAAKSRLDKMGAAIQRGIDNKTLTGEKLDKALERYNQLKNQLENKDAYIKNQRYKIVAEQDQKKQIKAQIDIMAKNNSRISDIDNRLKNTSLSTAERMNLQTERNNLVKQNAQAKSAIEGITRRDAIDSHRINLENKNNRVSEIDQILAGTMSDRVISDCHSQLNSINTKYSTSIADIDAKLSATGLSRGERNVLMDQKNKLIGDRDTEISRVRSALNARITELQNEKTSAQNSIKDSREQLVKINAEKAAAIDKIAGEYIKADVDLEKAQIEEKSIENEIRMVREGIHQSGWRSTVNSYFGGTPISGKGYSEFASLLGQNRNSIYIQEAMTKMSQNASILVDENGNEVQLQSKYIPGGRNGKTITYRQMRALYQNQQGPGLTAEDRNLIAGIGLDEDMIESAWKDIEKTGAMLYVTANVEEIINPSHEDIREKHKNDPKLYEKDPRYVDTTMGGKYSRVRLARHEENSTIREWYYTFLDEINKSAIPDDMKANIRERFLKDPGSFIGKASDEKSLYSMVGKKIVDGQKPSDGNK